MLTALTKEESLIEWANQKKIFSSVDLTRYGLENQYIRAPRTMREFVENGDFRRIPDNEAVLRGLVRKGNAHIAWYETVKKFNL